MTVNIHEPTRDRAIARNRYVGKDTRQRPGASQWITVLNANGDGDPECPPDQESTDPIHSGLTVFDWTPCFQNGYLQVEDPLELFAFRKHYDGSLEFMGHIDVQNASSGDIAFTLPGIAGGEPDYTLAKDRYFHITITDNGGTNFIIAMVFIDSTTGDVSLVWPAS